MRSVRLLALLTAWFLVMCTGMLPAFAQDAAEPVPSADKPMSMEELHEIYLNDSELQLERPGRQEREPVQPPDPPPGWLRAIANFFSAVLNAIGPALGYIGLAVLIALVGWLLWFLFGEALSARFGGMKKDKDAVLDSHATDIRPDEASARSLLEEADLLASQGRYAEAVHLLLFRSIEDIQAQKDGRLSNALTAREIGGLSDLPDRARSALSPIIRVVERSFFGGREVDGEGWQTARASYEDFAFGGLPNG